tara:strand:+ start:470 stop:1309 length:840 start_codon:yes stop_codon:yes gene_type:complete
MASQLTFPPGVFQTICTEDSVYWGGETEIELSLIPRTINGCPVGGMFSIDGEDIHIINGCLAAIEEERNKELDRKIRILGEVMDAMEHYDGEWYSRIDSWSKILPLDGGEEEWTLHRVWAHFMLFRLDEEISQILQEAEEDFEYETWINSKQYNQTLEEYNRHKLLAYEKGQSPNWVGECTGDFAMTTKSHGKSCVLYQTSLKERYVVDAVIQTEFPEDRGKKAYAKASSVYGDIYVPYRFYGYIGQPGSPQQMTVALQDVGDGNRKANGFRWTCIYTH